MKDIFGHELGVGDAVALNQPGYKWLVVGEIVDFTSKMVKVAYVDWRNKPSITLEKPKNLVKKIV